MRQPLGEEVATTTANRVNGRAPMREKPIPSEMVFDHNRVFLFECENRFRLITDEKVVTCFAYMSAASCF